MLRAIWRLLSMLTAYFEQIPHHNNLGLAGEKWASRFLRRKGWFVVGHRVRLSKGELDLVAIDGEFVVFVEVKTRSGDFEGHPEDAVNFKKQQQLVALAREYIHRHDLDDVRVRFDVVAVQWIGANSEPKIRLIQDAFPADEPTRTR